MAVAFFSCEQASVGLGPKVDVFAPVVGIHKNLGPTPGSFISGVQRIYISATDDNGIKSVKLTYIYRVVQPDGKLKEQAPVTVSAQRDAEQGEYFVDIDTTGMADGSLAVELAAWDNSDKQSKSEKLIYIVKNAPPTVDIQVPQPRKKDGHLNNADSDGDSLPVVITNNYIMGIYQDLAGVASAYPQIQFWPDPDGQSPPPQADTGNAGWERVTLNDGANDGWIPVDQGRVESGDGEKGNSFRYYLRAHNPDGTPMLEQSGVGLSQGKYSFRVKIRDIMGKELIWPQDSYENKPDRIRMELLTTGTPPLITIVNPKSLYQRANFTIEVKAEPRGDNDNDIGELTLEIPGKNGAGVNRPLVLKRWTAPNLGIGVIKSHSIEIGKTYYSEKIDGEAIMVDDETKVPANAFAFVTFNDGGYNFIVRAASWPTGATGQETLTLYIDRSPPAISVTEVKPFFSKETISSAGTVPYHRWTVNSTVKIGVSSTDNRGNALDEQGRMEFKYLLLKDNNIAESDYTAWQNTPAGTGKSFGDYLFEKTEAVYFDEVKGNPVLLNPPVLGNTNPLIAVSGGDGAYTLTLQTRHYDLRDEYYLWFYIVSRDNAGNASYSRALLYVDQETDKPALKFGSFNQGNSSGGLDFADETTKIRLELHDDDGLDPGTLEYRFTVKHGAAWSPWISLPLSPSGDMLSLALSDLSLKTIYRDLAKLDGTAPVDFDNASDGELLRILGSEMDIKAIQARVKDDVNKKILKTDGVRTGETGEILFTMDLTWPKIIPASRDNAAPANSISRTDDDPFVAPQKDRAYQRVFTAYGDLDERNLKSFSIIIDGVHRISFPVPDSLPDSEPSPKALTSNSLYQMGGTGQSERPVPAVWKTQNPWNGELRWRFPLDYEVPAVFNGTKTAEVTPAYILWDKLGEGAHTLMLQVEDKVPRTVSKQITFYKDSRGPAINLITLNEKVYLSDQDVEYISKNTNISTDLQNRYNKIKTMTLKEKDAKIIGTFTDEFSTVNSHFWYRIDNGRWIKKDLTAPGKTAAWELVFTSSDDGELDDGLHRLSIRVADSLGNGYGFEDLSYTDSNPPNGSGSETNISFILDREEPELLITAPYADKDSTERVDVYSSGNSGSGDPVIRLSGLVNDSSLHGQTPLTAVSDSSGNPALPLSLNKINWLGRLAAKPLSPKVWDAYHNTLDGSSQYWDGFNWQLLNPLRPGYEPAGGSVITWFWSLEVNKNLFTATFPEDKRYSITLTAEDSGGRRTRKSWAFIRDNTPPSVELINGSPGNAGKPVIILEANPKIQGTVSDASGKVSKVEVKLERYVYDVSAGNPPYRWEVIQANSKDWEDLGVTANSTVTFVKDLGIADSGGLPDGAYRIALAAWDNAVNTANRVETPIFEFILDRTSPVLTGPKPASPFCNKAFDISGRVTEKNGVTITAKLGTGDIESKNITVNPSGDGIYDWTVTVPVTTALAETSHTVTITAADPAGRISTATYNFTYDKTPPGAAFTAPGTGVLLNKGSLSYGEWSEFASNIWVNGITDIRGNADDKNGIASISYHLGKLPGNSETDFDTASWTDTLLQADKPSAGWSGGLYYWTFTNNFNAYETVPGAIDRPGTGPAFHLPMYVKVLDEAGNMRILRYNIWVDPDMDRPQVSISSPSSGATVGGEIRISGTAQDDDWIHHVEIRIIDKSKNPGERGYYYKNANEQFIYGENPVDSGNKGWLLAHIAGNTNKLVAWYYTVNSDGLLNPAPGTTRPVEIEVRGVDTQDDLHQHPMIPGSAERIALVFDSNVPTISNVKVVKDNKTLDFTAGIRIGGEFTITADVRDEGGISSIKARETRDTAFADMQSNSKPSWSVNKPAALNQTAWIPGFKYNIINAGTIGNWAAIDADWVSGKIYKPGLTFRYKYGAPLPDGAGAIAYQAQGSPATSDTDPAWHSQYFEYKISVNVTSTDFYRYGETGNYTLELQATDNNIHPAPYVTTAFFNIMVDNYYPTARFTTQYNASTENFYISGTAQDYDSNSGNIQGLERVLVYFERNGVYQNAAGVNEPGRIAYAQGKEGGAPARADPTGIAGFPVLTLEGGVWKSKHAMVIDRQEIGAGEDSDHDGTPAERWEDLGAVKEWQARFNTTVPGMTDGPITVHYVIMDQAGNASHYTQDIYIRNNPPIIREFNLGTDLDKDGVIDPDREYSQDTFIIAAIDNKGTADKRDDTITSLKGSAVETGFTIRNKQLEFDLNTFGGNGRKHYRVSYVTQGAQVDSTALVTGEVYTIKTPGNTLWTRLGAPDNNPGTTFVASGKAPALTDNGGKTSGAAISYTYVASKEDGFTADSARPSGYSDKARTLFKDADFDTIGDSITGPNQPLTHSRYFIIKIYDTTVAGGSEEKQLAHAVLLTLDVDNLDETPPVVKVEPFYWKSGDDNSLYDNKILNGHIELESDLLAAFTAGAPGVMDRDPKVSGRISLRGTASDNAMLKRLWIYLDGFQFAGGTVKTVNGRDYVLAAEYLGGEKWKEYGDWSKDEWKFTVDTAGQVHNNVRGHIVKWRLDINTAKITGVTAADRAFRILSEDAHPNDSAESNVQTGTFETPYYRMDVVPYITEVETRLSAFNRTVPSVYARTAQGKYTVAEKDNIVIYGFNFGDNPAISLSGRTFTVSQANRGTGTGSRASWQFAKLNLDSGAASGELSLVVNGINTMNNANDNRKEYNQQPNEVNNNTLTDDMALDVWQFTEVFKSRSEARYPVMKVGPQGQIGFSFANDYQWFNMPGYIYDKDSSPEENFWSQTLYQNGWGGYTHNTFAFDSTGNTYGVALNIDEAGPAQSANFSFMNRRPHTLPEKMIDSDNYSGVRLNSIRLENTTLPSNPSSAGGYIVDINRIQSPVMVTSMPNPKSPINDTNNRVSVYMAYYDRTTGQVRFRGGTTGANRSKTTGSDFEAKLDTDGRILSDNHKLAKGTPLYLRSSSPSVKIDKTKPYYVANENFSANYFMVTDLLGGRGIDINSTGGRIDITVSVTGGGLVDLSGYVADGSASRINHVDARPDAYQTVASSGGYNPGKKITYDSSGTTYTTTYPDATTYGPGAYVAIGVVKDGGKDVVVLAWYDEVNSQLVYSWNTDPAGNSAKQWQANAKVIEGYAGEGISIATDNDGGIHLAYYTAKGADLKYAYASSYREDFKTAVVDAYLSVGTHSTITVGKNAGGKIVPYISYYAIGAAALRAKLAYRDYEKDPGDIARDGADGQDRFTGAWEVSTVPTPRTPTEYRISVGVWTNDMGNIQALPTNAAGTVVTGAPYAPKVAVDAPTRLYGNGTLNPVVGYGTTTNLEMAQKK
jgi:hypothetical protein